MINKYSIPFSIGFYFPESDELVNIKNTSDEISIKFNDLSLIFFLIDLFFDHISVFILKISIFFLI